MTFLEEVAQRIDKVLDGDCGYGTGEYLAEQLAPLIAEHDAKVRAEAIRTLRDDDEFFARGEEDQSDDYKRGVNNAADELFALMDEAADTIEREAGLK